jgi:hypothetical protein
VGVDGLRKRGRLRHSLTWVRFETGCKGLSLPRALAASRRQAWGGAFIPDNAKALVEPAGAL